MACSPLPPLPTVISFIDCINRTDLDGLAALMHEKHRLIVLDEPPLIGKAANVDAWRGYFDSYPEYVIYPSSLASDGSSVVVDGVTTGSHLQLPDEEESKLRVTWRAEVADGLVALWHVADATAPA